MKLLYTAYALATGGREGVIAANDRHEAMPTAIPGNGQAGTTPEQLFAAAYATCFGTTAKLVAEQMRLPLGVIEVKSEVSLHQDDKGYFIAPVLDVQLPHLDATTATALVLAAHNSCPYSKAMRGNIETTLKINGKPLKN